MEKVSFLVLTLMLISRLIFHAGSHTIILDLMLVLMLIATSGNQAQACSKTVTILPKDTYHRHTQHHGDGLVAEKARTLYSE